MRVMRMVIAVLAALAVGVGIGFVGAEYADNGAKDAANGDDATSETGRPLKGIFVLDGAGGNGCAGDQIAVQVRDDTGVVAAAFADSRIEGADCVYRFSVPIPPLDCHRLVIAGTHVGSYPDSALRPDYDVGYIDSESAYGDSPSEPVEAEADFSGC